MAGAAQARGPHGLAFRLAALTSAAVMGLSLAGCGAGNQTENADDDSHISFMLDWTPNTNHVGIYAARHLGYFKDAGIEVRILPTAQAGAETSVQNRVTDVGFSKLSNLATFNSQGSSLKQVFNLGQHSVARWCSLASRTDIQTPKDFDGKTFVSFGSAEQTAVVQQMIRHAGGNGEFKRVTSGTNTFATLTSGKGDFAGFYANWEGVESEIEGPALHCFTQSDWGVPGNPDQLGFVVRDSWLDQPGHRKALQKFITASMRGYDYSLAHPDEAARILVQETKGSNIDPELASKSMESIVKEGYWVETPGQKTISGMIDMDDAQSYLDFQFKAGTYKDAKKGDPDKAPQASDLWTDEFVKEARKQ